MRILQLRENVDPDNLEKILYDEEGDDDESGSGKKASGSKKSKGDDDGDDDDDDDDDNDANAMMDGQKNGTRKQRDPLLKYG